jgi:hypothetical protein
MGTASGGGGGGGGGISKCAVRRVSKIRPVRVTNIAISTPTPVAATPAKSDVVIMVSRPFFS